MKPLLACALVLGVFAAAPAAWADPPQHPNRAAQANRTVIERKTVIHQPTETRRVIRTRTVSPARRAVITRRTVTVRHPVVRTTTVRRPVVTTTRKTTVRRPVVTNTRNRIDITRYRKIVHAPRRFHAARAWNPPRGFTYRRFSLGERVPGILLVTDFFLMDFSLYGLEEPPYGYIWVRDGDDAVLVDRETGEVIAVEYDVFY